MTFSDLFKVTIIQRQITWKWYNIQLYLQWPTNRKSCMIYRTAPFSMTLNGPYSQFQGYAIFWRLISHKRYDIHNFNEIPIGTYKRPTQQCHFEWPWVTLSDLAKYSMTRSARGLSATAELLVIYLMRGESIDLFWICNSSLTTVLHTRTFSAAAEFFLLNFIDDLNETH